jgi:hypothetical protein
LDVGYESGTTPQNFRSEIRASTIQRVAEIGGSIVITIYPASGEEEAVPGSVKGILEK